MKKLLVVAVCGLVLGVVGHAFADQVNPTSNVLGDTSGTGGTLVLRNSAGQVDANHLLSNESIITQHIKTNAVLTRHTYLDLPTLKILCVKTNKNIGYCSGQVSPNVNQCDCQ